jgi:hypothetical protein
MWEDFGSLIGVVIGGFIALGTTLEIERRRKRREERAEKRAVRQATRMLHSELNTIATELAGAVAERRWWNRADLVLETPSWGRFADALAGSDIDDDTWWAVAYAYTEIHSLDETIRRGLSQAKMAGTYQLDFEVFAETVTRVRDAVLRGLDTLADLIEVAAPPRP